jgi:hypothetical protein
VSDHLSLLSQLLFLLFLLCVLLAFLRFGSHCHFAHLMRMVRMSKISTHNKENSNPIIVMNVNQKEFNLINMETFLAHTSSTTKREISISLGETVMSMRSPTLILLISNPPFMKAMAPTAALTIHMLFMTKKERSIFLERRVIIIMRTMRRALALAPAPAK